MLKGNETGGSGRRLLPSDYPGTAGQGTGITGMPSAQPAEQQQPQCLYSHCCCTSPSAITQVQRSSTREGLQLPVVLTTTRHYDGRPHPHLSSFRSNSHVGERSSHLWYVQGWRAVSAERNTVCRALRIYKDSSVLHQTRHPAFCTHQKVLLQTKNTRD